MKRRPLLPALSGLFCLLLVLSALRAAPAQGAGTAAPPPLNFVFILVDDWGWTDLGCYGSSFYETPHLDRLAAQGARFTQAYAACTVCSPTRAAVMTGKYPARLHLTDWIKGHVMPKAKLRVPDWTMYLPLEETTVAEALKPAGYATASIGKWHLGEKPLWPEHQGFDLNLGGCDRGQPPSYFSPYRIPTLPDGPEGEFLTDRESAEACKFIAAHRDRPFFLYLAHHAVHTPLMGKKEVVAKYAAKARPDQPQSNPTYAALVESVDDSVGRIMRQLDALGLAERTVVFVTGDNGGLVLRNITHNLGLRAGKGSAYEGGVRVPLIVRWPGVVTPGRVIDTPVMSIDFLPTMVELAGRPARAGQVVDGTSLVPLLRGAAPDAWKRDTLYWHYPHYHPGGATPYSAIRVGDWKLVEFFEDQHVELYNLKADQAETRDLARQEPARVADLRARLQAWRASVGAQLPTPNPDWDPNFVPPSEAAPKKQKPKKKSPTADLPRLPGAVGE